MKTSTSLETSTRRKILRAAAFFPFVTVCGMAFGFTIAEIGYFLLPAKAPGMNDYVIYWATAQQLAHHANPYDMNAVTQIEHMAGLAANVPVGGVMRNPPWALPLVLPLEFLGQQVGWLLWFSVLLACFAVSVHLLWIVHGRPRNRRYLLGYSFGPALICLAFGQTTLFSLLGLVLFLRLHRTRPFLAGAALWLCMLKPHLFLPFGVVLLVWVLVSKSYKIMAGAAVALGASCAITYFLDPLAWTHYSQMMRISGINQELIPCLSFLLRHWLSPQSIWLQYVPASLACAWALAYFWPRRQRWN